MTKQMGLFRNKNMQLFLWISAIIFLTAVNCERVCYEDVGCFSNEAPFSTSWNENDFLPQNRNTVNVNFKLYIRNLGTSNSVVGESRLRSNRPSRYSKVTSNIATKNSPRNEYVSDPTRLRYNEDVATLWESKFVASKPTKVIIHGRTDSGDAAWVKSMEEKFLYSQDMNVITVYWVTADEEYLQAVANARLVGAEIINLLTSIKEWKSDFDFSTVHLIGHGLGAHIASFVGSGLKSQLSTCHTVSGQNNNQSDAIYSTIDNSGWWRLPQWLDSWQLVHGDEKLEHACKKFATIGRITGLDPTGKWFQNADEEARLDSSDALFVDVIHTDMHDNVLRTGLGIREASGHLDFYPNGGRKQPGCEASRVNGLDLMITVGNTDEKQQIFCNYYRAVDLFIESLDPSKPPLHTFPCKSLESFQAGKCTSCQPKSEDDGILSGFLKNVWDAAWPVSTKSTSQGKRQRRSERSCPVLGIDADKFWIEQYRSLRQRHITSIKAFSNTQSRSPFSARYAMVTLLLPSGQNFGGSFSFSFQDYREKVAVASKPRRVIHELANAQSASFLLPIPYNFAKIFMVKITWTKPVLNSWWGGSGGWWESTNTRQEEKFNLPSVEITRPPLNIKSTFCTARGSLRSGREGRYLNCD